MSQNRPPTSPHRLLAVKVSWRRGDFHPPTLLSDVNFQPKRLSSLVRAVLGILLRLVLFAVSFLHHGFHSSLFLFLISSHHHLALALSFLFPSFFFSLSLRFFLRLLSSISLPKYVASFLSHLFACFVGFALCFSFSVAVVTFLLCFVLSCLALLSLFSFISLALSLSHFFVQDLFFVVIFAALSGS